MKKLIALLLCLVLVLACLAGCTKTESKTNGKKEDKQAISTEDLGKLPLTTKKEVITIGLPANPNTEDYETNEYTLWLEEQTGIDLKFVTFSNDKTESVTQLNLMISGGEKLPDILWNFQGIDAALRSELGQDGVVLDLTEYFEKYGYWYKDTYSQMSEMAQKNMFAYGKDATTGALYAYPAYEGAPGAYTFAEINKVWLDKIGEDIPTTVEELHTVLQKFATEDPNGNGKADELPFICYDGYRADLFHWFINAYVYVNDGYFWNATDGKIWAPYNTDEYREALKTLNAWYKEGLIAPMSFTMKENAEMTAVFTPSDQTALCGILAAHPILTTETDNPVLLEYVAIPNLKAATDKGGYSPKNDDTYRYATYITKSCENPVLAFRLLDFMSTFESSMRQRYGVKGRDWTDPDPGTFDCYGQESTLKILDDTVYGAQNNINWHDLGSEVMPLKLYASQYEDDGSWMAYRQSFVNNAAANTASGKGTAIQPDELVYTLLYNDEETEVVSEYSALLKEYVKEARSMFITGVMDPNDDAQWKSYLDAMESQGLSKLQEAAQTAYTRMNG